MIVYRDWTDQALLIICIYVVSDLVAHINGGVLALIRRSVGGCCGWWCPMLLLNDAVM